MDQDYGCRDGCQFLCYLRPCAQRWQIEIFQNPQEPGELHCQPRHRVQEHRKGYCYTTGRKINEQPFPLILVAQSHKMCLTSDNVWGTSGHQRLINDNSHTTFPTLELQLVPHLKSGRTHFRERNAFSMSNQVSAIQARLAFSSMIEPWMREGLLHTDLALSSSSQSPEPPKLWKPGPDAEHRVVVV